MSLFPDTVAASLSGETVSMAYLVKLDFLTDPFYVWTGFGNIVSGGQTWRGLGELGQINNLEQAIAGEAPETTVSVDMHSSAVTRLARSEFDTEANGRKMSVFVQFMVADSDRLLDGPMSIWSGIMRTPKFEITADGLSRLTLNVESVFSKRSRPNHSLYTDKDQDRRFSGDRGFEFVGSLQNKVVTWPDF